MDGHYIIYDGALLPRSEPIITCGNRGFRYGDGLFETMLLCGRKINNERYHFERLFSGILTLKFFLPSHFNSEYLRDAILRLIEKNKCSEFAKLRLVVFRKDGNISDHRSVEPSFIIETFSLGQPDLAFNPGLTVDIMPGIRKSCDGLSGIKSNNYLPYTLAAMHAAESKLDECVILNQHDRVCEGTISNIFIVRNKSIYTPPLSEGAVAGTMRRTLLESGGIAHFNFLEEVLSIDDLKSADEVFLTNAVRIVRPVKTFREKTYSTEVSKEIYKHLWETISP